MIKFKKIMQKAAGRSGRGAGTKRGELGAPAGAVVMEAAAEEPSFEEPLQETAAATEDAAVTPPEESEASIKESEALITDELVADVLDSMYEEKKALAGEAPLEATAQAGVEETEAATEAEEGAGETGLFEAGETTQPEEVPPSEEETTGPEAVQAEEPAAADNDRVIEEMIDDAFSAVEAEQKIQEQAEKQGTTAQGEETDFAATEVNEEAEEKATAQETPEGTSSKPIDSSFMAEVDRLLSEFGTFDAFEESESESTADLAAMGLPPSVEEALTGMEGAAAAEPEPAAEAGSEPAKERPGQATGPAKFKIAARKDQKRAGAVKNRTQHTEGEEEPKFEAKDEDFADTLTQEEKDALFAEESAFELDALGQEVVAEVEGAAGAEVVQEGPPAEVLLDFTAGSVGLEAEAEEAPAKSEGEELLSKVLADLDKIGTVDKPQQDEQKEEAERDEDEIEDFSEILSELNSQAPQPGQAPAEPEEPTQAAAEPQERAIDVKVESLSEEEIIGDALKAADEEPEADILAELSRSAEAAGAAKRGKEGASAGDEKGEDEDDDNNGGSADVEDEAALLANLEASMEAAEEERKAQGEFEEPDRKEFARGEKEEEEADENAIRKEVLSRTKEVEQKILDDVFGESNKDYRAELKAEMKSVEAAQETAGDRASALAAESARQAATAQAAEEGEGTGGAQFVSRWVGDMPALMWLALKVNKPFQRWLNPERTQLLGAVSLALLASAAVWLAAALARLFWPA